MRRKTYIKNMDTALRIFYTYPELQNKQIRELFGKLADSTLVAWKKEVKKVQAERNIKTSLAGAVNTRIAFEVWGIDIDDIENRRAKLKKLGLQA